MRTDSSHLIAQHGYCQADVHVVTFVYGMFPGAAVARVLPLTSDRRNSTYLKRKTRGRMTAQSLTTTQQQPGDHAVFALYHPTLNTILA